MVQEISENVIKILWESRRRNGARIIPSIRKVYLFYCKKIIITVGVNLSRT
jgi:hypothetical protein